MPLSILDQKGWTENKPRHLYQFFSQGIEKLFSQEEVYIFKLKYINCNTIQQLIH